MCLFWLSFALNLVAVSVSDNSGWLVCGNYFQLNTVSMPWCCILSVQVFIFAVFNVVLYFVFGCRDTGDSEFELENGPCNIDVVTSLTREEFLSRLVNACASFV